MQSFISLNNGKVNFGGMLKKLKNIQTPLKIFISLGIIALIFFRLDLEEFKNVINQIDITFWGYAIVLTLAQFFLLSLRWKILINIGQYRMNYLQSLQVTLASFLANTLFIATISGIAVRIALALQYGSSVFKALFATGIDRFLTLFALTVFSSIFLPALSNYLDGTMYKNTVIFVGVVTFIFVVFTPLITLFLLKRVPQLSASKGKINSGVRYITILINSRKTLFKLILISLTAQLFFFIAIYLLSISASVNLSFLQIMTVLPVITLIASLPISIGGWGVREGAFVFGLGLLGVPMETAFLVSVQIGLISMVTIILSGIPAILSEKNFNTFSNCFSKK